MATVAPLVVIVGETGSGKTALGIELAKQFSGEIICADSRTIYRGMDIGTAKPTMAEQDAVRHHLLDIRNPDERYSAAEFQRDAQAAIDAIAHQGNLPIMVGGSGLYIDAILYGYQFTKEHLPKNAQNPRHLAANVGPKNRQLRMNTLVLGMQRDTLDLKDRITNRVEGMIKAGLVAEVKQLIDMYGKDIPAFNGICYQHIAAYLKGDITLEEAKDKFIRGDLLLAKKQRTWFKRNKSIHWVRNGEEAVAIVTTFLNK